jgi:hypothetical protein
MSNIEEDEELEYEPVNYESNSKGQEIMKCKRHHLSIARNLTYSM